MYGSMRSGARRAGLLAVTLAAALITPLIAPLDARVAAQDAEPVPIAATPGSVALLPTGAINANSPSLTGDGRWVVFGATLDDGRRSAFRADLHTGAIDELSLVPAGARPGDTVHARISADGCVVVAITELAFDLFRDDDRDARWDVYRLLVPECGGQPNGWELVSATVTGVARDGVFTDSAPAVSGSGAVVAYVHQSDAVNTPLATISVVDITIPVDDPARSREVAGMPIEAPNRAYRYRGAHQPALSQNGRHLAFTSDAVASDPLPGWAPGREPGGWATTQVYVWDRGAADQLRAVHLASGASGVAAELGAHSPAMSEDGRVIVFASPDRELVTAILPRCDDECPTQVYRFDRDTDGNGIFDEPARLPDLALVSAVPDWPRSGGIPTAGDAASWAAAVNADGSSIAFVTDASNLLPSRRAGGGRRHDGDLVVAEFHLGEIRRVLDDEALTDVPGAHGHPALSQTGSVLVFDSLAAEALAENLTPAGGEPLPFDRGRNLVVTRVAPKLNLAALDFGSVLLAFESAELYATVQNAGPAAFEPSEVVIDSTAFKVTGGTCTRGIIVAAGSFCSVKLTFSPTDPRGYAAELTVRGFGADAPSVSAPVRGAAGDPTLLATPGGVDFAPGTVGEVAGRVAVSIENVSFLPTQVRSVALQGHNPDDFAVVSQACTGRALNANATCAVEVEFRPRAPGYRSALLVATTTAGQYTAAVLGGYARYTPTFGVADQHLVAGEQFGVGGNGFPANATVRIGFDDGSAPLAEVTTTSEGGFLAQLDLPALVRGGERRIVASGPDGAVAAADVIVRSRGDSIVPRTPGAGMG